MSSGPHEAPLAVEARTLSTGRQVAYVPGFQARYGSTAGWEARAIQRLPARLRRVEDWLRLAAHHGADPRAGRVLEVATGPGLDLRLLASLAGRPVWSVDLDQRLRPGADGPQAHPRLHATLDDLIVGGRPVPRLGDRGRVRLGQMDARALAFADRAFDLVLCKSTLKLIPGFAEALRECLRVLRPGGLCLVIDEPFPSLFGLCRGGVTDVPWAHLYLTEAEFAETLPAAGPVRDRALANWRSAARLYREDVVRAAWPGAALVAERCEYEPLAPEFLAAVFGLVPELAALDREQLLMVEAQWLFQVRGPAA